jgi:hypothetical protein
VFALAHGHWPVYHIDHINGDPLDNRPENLRDVPASANARNAAVGKNNKSGVIGVRFHAPSGKWRAQIKHNYRARFLGSFPTKAEAIEARQKAEAEFGFHANHGRAA